MGYTSDRAKSMTIFNIHSNSGYWILRFVIHNGKLVVNDRIVGVWKVLKNESSWREITKGLITLLIHVMKLGL